MEYIPSGNGPKSISCDALVDETLEKIYRSGTRAADRFVRSAQSRPLVARIAISRLRSAIAANPSG